MDRTDEILLAMIDFDRGDAKRIQHFMKVYEFARLIGVSENMPAEELEILKAASILHDIGIHPSEVRYGDCSGRHQEELGPEYAGKLLRDLGIEDEAFITRVCFLIAHHHTYTGVDGMDYRILIEADFLVNSMEDNMDTAAILNMRERIFRTETGRRLLDMQFGLS